jgi:hypothetical protein
MDRSDNLARSLLAHGFIKSDTIKVTRPRAEVFPPKFGKDLNKGQKLETDMELASIWELELRGNGAYTVRYVNGKDQRLMNLKSAEGNWLIPDALITSVTSDSRLVDFKSIIPPKVDIERSIWDLPVKTDPSIYYVLCTAHLHADDVKKLHQCINLLPSEERAKFLQSNDGSVIFTDYKRLTELRP